MKARIKRRNGSSGDKTDFSDHEGNGKIQLGSDSIWTNLPSFNKKKASQ